VNELAALPIGRDAAGVPVGPAVADPEHEVAVEEGGVAVTMLRLQADHAGVEPVIVGDGTPTHKGRHHRRVGKLREFYE